MPQSTGFVPSRPASLPPSSVWPQPSVLVSCEHCGEALLLFEQVTRTLHTMRSYGAELQSLAGDTASAYAQCRHCGAMTRFDRRLLPHPMARGPGRA